MRACSMRVRRAGWVTGGTLALATAVGGCAGMMGTAPPVECEGASAPDRWTLQAGSVLQGVVADTRGLPITGATVRMRPVGGDSAAARETVTAGQGAFAFDTLSPGRYVARAGAPRYGTWQGIVELAPDGGTVPRIRLCRPPGP
jgi:hypothetical protein